MICIMSEVQYSFYSGVPISANILPREGRIGERPEVIYHVIQSLLLGSLAMTFEG